MQGPHPRRTMRTALLGERLLLVQSVALLRQPLDVPALGDHYRLERLHIVRKVVPSAEEARRRRNCQWRPLRLCSVLTHFGTPIVAIDELGHRTAQRRSQAKPLEGPHLSLWASISTRYGERTARMPPAGRGSPVGPGFHI